MRVYDLLRRKRDGVALSTGEIQFLVEGYVAGRIPDYQMSALLMSIYFRGMTDAELLALTQAMIASGEILSLSQLGGIVVDKHSTGGVGDKTTLVLVPLVAAAGVPVVKMSGRGLGHTGGTLDKLESFSGLRTDLPLDEMIAIAQSVGACLGGQTGNLTPADKKLYALRDVTATVESIPLIAASVMSKKLAAGADAIVLDVKYGRGALVHDIAGAERLAETMVAIAKGAGKRAVALITAMEQPLGYAVGNALEVREALATLRGEGPSDLVELVVALGVEMLQLSGRVRDVSEADSLLRTLLTNGQGLAKLRAMVSAQGGDADAVDHADRLPQAAVVVDVRASSKGIVQAIDALEIGDAAMRLGAGRATQDAPIDLSVGIELFAKVGMRVDKGDLLGRIHASTDTAAALAVAEVMAATEIGAASPVQVPLIHTRIAVS